MDQMTFDQGCNMALEKSCQKPQLCNVKFSNQNSYENFMTPSNHRNCIGSCKDLNHFGATFTTNQKMYLQGGRVMVSFQI
jgi:hypothetical protein